MQPYNLNPGPEALRWLGIAEKLLQTRDLVGSKTFATRARESDPRLEHADQILAIADTLIAGEEQISHNHLDWYAILQLARRTHDSELIASQYRRLALLLNPNRNKFPFAEHAFKLVAEAWLVLSNPSRKFQFDNEFGNSSNNSHFNFIHEPQQLNNSTHFNFIQEHSEQLHQSAPLQQQQQFLPPFPQQQLFPQQQPPQTFNLQQQQHHIQPLPQHPPRSNQSQQPLPRPQPQQPMPRSQPQPSWPQPQKPSPQQPQPRKPSPQQPQPQKPSPSQPQPQPQPQPEQSLPQPREQGENGSMWNGNDNIIEEENGANDDNADNDVNVEESSSFWTACPYCYNMYEYLRAYAECTLRCQNCKRAFHAVQIASPPPTPEGKDAYFCCWGFFPLGSSTSYLEKNKKSGSNWTPFSTMFAFPQGKSNVNVGKRNNVRKNSGPWIYIDDDQEVFVELSSSDDSDDDWRSNRKKKKAKSAKCKGLAAKIVKRPRVDKVKKAKGGNGGNSQGGVVAQEGVDVGVPNVTVPNVPVVETSKKAAVATIRKQPGRVAKDLGKLDLNVEFSNEVEEPTPGTSGGNKAGNGVEDNIEGIGFFEGLDEFLSSLPILNVVGDDKVKAG